MPGQLFHFTELKILMSYSFNICVLNLFRVKLFLVISLLCFSSSIPTIGLSVGRWLPILILDTKSEFWDFRPSRHAIRVMTGSDQDNDDDNNYEDTDNEVSQFQCSNFRAVLCCFVLFLFLLLINHTFKYESLTKTNNVTILAFGNELPQIFGYCNVETDKRRHRRGKHLFSCSTWKL